MSSCISILFLRSLYITTSSIIQLMSRCISLTLSSISPSWNIEYIYKNNKLIQFLSYILYLFWSLFMLEVIVSIIVLLLVFIGGLLVWRSKLSEKDKSENILLIILLLALLIVVSELKHFNYLSVSLFSDKADHSLEALFFSSN